MVIDPARRDRARILLLGTDYDVSGACVRNGVDAVVVCGSRAFDNGNYIPDGVQVVRVENFRSPEDVLAALRRAGLADVRFDAVQTTDEFCLVNAAVLGNYLNAPAIDAQVAVNFRDKYLQKSLVGAAGLTVARSRIIEDIYDVGSFTSLPFDRGVLKPIAGAGTARTTVVESITDLEARSQECREQRSAERTFVLEEFVTGDEWVADGFVFDGELRFFALGKYGDPLLAAVENQLTIWKRFFDPASDAWAYESAEPVVRGALAALGLTQGVFHMELFHDAATGEVIFSECAARRGGAMAQEEVLAKFNVDLGEAALMCALGRRPEPQVRVRPECMGYVYLPTRPGVLVDCPLPREIEALENVVYARIDTTFGAVIPKSVSSSSERIGQMLLAARTEEDFLKRAAEIQAWFKERLVVAPMGTTPRVLRDWQRETFPERDFRILPFTPN